MMGQPLLNHHGPGWAPALDPCTSRGDGGTCAASCSPYPALSPLNKGFQQVSMQGNNPLTTVCSARALLQAWPKALLPHFKWDKQFDHRSGQDQEGFSLTAMGSHPEKSPWG